MVYLSCTKSEIVVFAIPGARAGTTPTDTDGWLCPERVTILHKISYVQLLYVSIIELVPFSKSIALMRRCPFSLNLTFTSSRNCLPRLYGCLVLWWFIQRTRLGLACLASLLGCGTWDHDSTIAREVPPSLGQVPIKCWA